MPEKVIIYRNPVEYWMWEEGGTLYLFLAVFLTIALYVTYLFFKKVYSEVLCHIEDKKYDDSFNLKQNLQQNTDKDKFNLL